MEKPHLHISYCTGCRWLMRAAWTAQELLSTFEEDLDGISLYPSENGGQFTISCGDLILHDRKTDGGFIELKILKQRIRDQLLPDIDLGHSG